MGASLGSDGSNRILVWVFVVASAYASLAATLQINMLGFEHSPFLLMTSPLGDNVPHRVNPFFGYGLILDDGSFVQSSLYHKENVSFLVLSRRLEGASSSVHFYDARAFFPFVMSCLGWAIGTVRAGIAANALFVAMGATAAFALARDLTRSNTGGWIAAGLAAIGAGFWLHLLDISAHVASFATYGAGCAAIYASRIWQEPKGWRTQLALICVLAIACATYSSGVYLIVVYVAAAALGRNNPLLAIPATVLGYGFGLGWLWVMEAFGGDTSGIRGFESDYLKRSLGLWEESFAENPADTVVFAARTTLDLLSPEPGYLLALILMCCGLLITGRSPGFANWRQVAILAAMILVPTLLALPWAQSAGARGYLSYHSYVGVYAALVALLFALRSKGVVWTILGSSILGAAALFQTIAMLSILEGNIALAETFFLGGAWDETLPGLLGTSPPAVVSFSGGEVPRFLGGSADVGSWLGSDRLFALDSFAGENTLLKAVAMRAYLFAPVFVLLFLLAAKSRHRIAALGGAIIVSLAAVLVPPFAAPTTLKDEVIRAGSFDSEVDSGNAQVMELEITLSEEAAAALAALAARQGHVEFAFGRPVDSATARMSVTFRGALVPLGEPVEGKYRHPYRVPASLFERVMAGERLVLRLEGAGSPLGPQLGYRPAATPGTRVTFDGQERATNRQLPMFEIRGYERGERYPSVLIL